MKAKRFVIRWLERFFLILDAIATRGLAFCGRHWVPADDVDEHWSEYHNVVHLPRKRS